MTIVYVFSKKKKQEYFNSCLLVLNRKCKSISNNILTHCHTQSSQAIANLCTKRHINMSYLKRQVLESKEFINTGNIFCSVMHSKCKGRLK